MSNSKLHNFLDKHALPTSFTGTSTHIILIGTSKGFLLKNIDTDNVIEYWCESGATTQRLVDILESRIQHTVSKHRHVAFYLWAGTCDLSVKRGKYIHLRSSDNSSVNNICLQYNRAVEIVHDYNQTIKLIDIPTFSLQLWNKVKCHPDPLSFKHDDLLLDHQVLSLNSHIVEINTKLGQNTLRFSFDLVKRRKDVNHVRHSYYFNRLYDGVHACRLLNQVWLRKIKLDICRNFVFSNTSDVVDIFVNEQDLLSIL